MEGELFLKLLCKNYHQIFIIINLTNYFFLQWTLILFFFYYSHVGQHDVIEFVEYVVRHIPSGVEGNGQSLETVMDVDMKSVAQLHTKLLAASARFENRAGEWERIIDEIDHYKIIISGVAPTTRHSASCYNRTYWAWRLHHADRTFKGLSIACMVMTAMMMWGQIAAALPPSTQISIWGGLLRGTLFLFDENCFFDYLLLLILLIFLSSSSCYSFLPFFTLFF